MTQERWREIDRILEAALELAPQQRAAFLQHACTGDADLRLEVEALLRANDQAGSFIEAPPATEMAELFDSSKHREKLYGQLIGPYRLAHELGRGGMGVVYLAARADDEFKKQVAIKLVWPGPQNVDLMRRFRRERQILANLDHLNIARLLDGGRTEQGWPYLVMEYIEGVPITTYCDGHRLSISERLKLFREVCAAVQYAHQNLVIHRDLKPGNIFVTKDGAVKLLDFGIAKLLKPDLSDATSNDTAGLTTGLHLMTPEYASPEHVRGEPVTTASDVYSLGLVLYELLTGHYPYRFKTHALHDVITTVCSEEPEPPSEVIDRVEADSDGSRDTRGATRKIATPAMVSRLREGKPEKLRARLRGDLDIIALKALRKDPRERYGAVEQLSEDIRRHLEGRPIFARKGSVGYQAVKFIRRHKLGAAAAAIVLLTLVGGIVATMWQARIAREQARINRRLAYAGQMALATQAWEMANVARMRELVENYLPRDGEEDLRGFEWYYLWRLYHHTGELFSLKHPSEVWAVAFAPDGKTFATGCHDGKARLWGAATGAQLAELSGHEEYIWAVAFSPNGRMLATGSGDRTAKLWEVATGRELATLKGHTRRVGAVAFSPDGKKLATCGRDDTVKLWDVATGRELMTIRGGAQMIYATSLAFSPDGKTLAVGRSSFKLYDATTGREIVNVVSNSGVGAVAFSPDGKTLVTADGSSRQAKLWDAATGRELAAFGDHAGEVRSVAFSPDGQRLATASSDRTVKLWDVAARREIATLKGHSSEVYSVAFSPDGKGLITGSADRAASLWDVAMASEPYAFNASPSRFLKVAIPPDGKKLATTNSHARVPMVWDATTLRELVELRRSNLGATSVAFSPDGKKVVTGNTDQTALLWDAATGQELVTFKGHTAVVRAVAFSPDGQRLATGSYDMTVRLWDTATGREILTLRGHEQRSEALAFSPDGKRLVTGYQDTTAKLWNVATGQELATFKGHANPIAAVAFSPDGETLATGSADSLVKLWQAGTGREIGSIKGHAGHVTTLAFSADGRRLATGGSEGLVRLWDVANGQELIALRGHAGTVNTVVFSADGTMMVSSAYDGFVRLWRAAMEQEVAATSRK